MNRKLLISFVGQLREFEHAVTSHPAFIDSLLSDQLDIYVSIVVWDTSFSLFPKNIESFIQTDITEEYIRSKILYSNKISGLTILVVPAKKATSEILAAKLRAVDDFEYVAYLHEKALGVMVDIENDGKFKFDSVLLTRPDLFIECSCIDPALMHVSPTTVYYKNALATIEYKSIVDCTSDNSTALYEQFVDQFNLFGRSAFYAYGLMYQFLCTDANSPSWSRSWLYAPSMHFWVNQYLEKFRITKGEMWQLQVRANIVRPIYKILMPTLMDAITIDALTELETIWQRNIDDAETAKDWVLKFQQLGITYEKR